MSLINQPAQVHAHGATHIHQHTHEHTHDHQRFADRNAAHFDANVAAPETTSYSPWLRMYAEFEREFAAQRDWIGLPASPSLRILDYACGGGHGSRQLLAHAREIRGVDVSAKSVASYNAWAAENVPDAADGRMRAVVGNLMTAEGAQGALAASDFFGFDLAICVMALHHVSDPPVLIRRLAERLRPGGTLLIIEWNGDGCSIMPSGADFVGHVVSANGFSEERMQRMFLDAGLDQDFAVHEMKGFTEVGVSAMFRGRKAVEEQ